MHTDLELLSLLALGEREGTEDERVHAETCPECATQLAELRQVVGLGRTVGADAMLATPREDVWDRIRAELSLTSEVGRPEGLPVLAGSRAAGGADHDGRRSLLAIVDAAIGGSPHDFESELTARAQLTPVDAAWSRASGRAELATDEHGRRLLQVALHADLPTTGLRQAWLVHRDDPSRRQSLGVMDGPHGLWTVEHSIDLNDYAILDISQQSPGESDHSGQTIVRGELTLTS